MKIGFDISAMQHPRGIQHGGSEYAQSVLMALLDQLGEASLAGFYRTDWALDQRIRQLCSDNNIQLFGGESFDSAGAFVKEHSIARFFSGVPYHFDKTDFGDAEFVAVVHGLRSIEIPTDRYEVCYLDSAAGLLKWLAKITLTKTYAEKQKRKMLGLVTKKNTQIIVSSEHSRFTILSQFPQLDPDRVKLRYCPPSAISKVDASDAFLSELSLKPGGYVLLVSTRRWEKNSYRALHQLAEGFSTHRELMHLQLVVTGGAPRFLSKRVEDRLRVLPYVDYPTLAGLYKQCFCFVYPTLNEGFGYPPLEAMAHGAPVIASASSSVPEVAGDGADYFDPRSRTELVSRVLRLKIQSGYREDLIARGAKRQLEIEDIQQSDLSGLVSSLTNLDRQ